MDKKREGVRGRFVVGVTAIAIMAGTLLVSAPAQAGLGMDALVIRGCDSLGGTVVRGRDGELYCR